MNTFTRNLKQNVSGFGKKIIKPILDEPAEILETAKNQVAPELAPKKASVENQVERINKPDENLDAEKTEVEKVRSQRMLAALNQEIEDIHNEKILQEQEKKRMEEQKKSTEENEPKPLVEVSSKKTGPAEKKSKISTIPDSMKNFVERGKQPSG